MTTGDPARHRGWELGLQAWRRWPWPGDVGRYRAKRWLTDRVNGPRPVPTDAGWLLLDNGDDTLEAHLLAIGTHWETQVVALLDAGRGSLRDATVLDVGGHVGFYAALLAERTGPGGQVVAVEAHAELCDRIRWAADRNGRPWLEVLHGAATDRPGPVTLADDADRGHTTGAVEGGATFVTPGLVLDHVFDGSRPDPEVVLMDIEGGEAAALRGLAGVLGRQAPDLVLEVHPAQLDALGSPQNELLGWLRAQAPYELAVIDHHAGVRPFDDPPDASSWHLLAGVPGQSRLLPAE